MVGLEQSVKSLTSQTGEQLTHLRSLACNYAALRTPLQSFGLALQAEWIGVA